MLYSEYISKAKTFCINIIDETDTAYLVPDYRYILHLAGLDLKEVTDFPDVTLDDVGENLKLEVEHYNVVRNKTKPLVDTVFDFIENGLGAVVTGEQNELFKNIIEYLKAKNSKPVQQEQAEQSEEKLPDNIVELTKYFDLNKKDRL